MLRTILALLILAHVASAQGAGSDAFKKEYLSLQRAVEEAVNTVPKSQILQKAKATYLEEFGVVVSIEVMLEPPPSPFEQPRPISQVRTSMMSSRKILQEKLELLLKQKVAGLQSVGDMQSIAIAVHLFNPLNVPSFPSQIVLTVKKQEPTKVTVREF